MPIIQAAEWRWCLCWKAEHSGPRRGVVGSQKAALGSRGRLADWLRSSPLLLSSEHSSERHCLDGGRACTRRMWAFTSGSLCRQWQGLRLKLGGSQNSMILPYEMFPTPSNSPASPHSPCLGRSHPGGLRNKQVKRKWLALFCTCPKTSGSDMRTGSAFESRL